MPISIRLQETRTGVRMCLIRALRSFPSFLKYNDYLAFDQFVPSLLDFSLETGRSLTIHNCVNRQSLQKRPALLSSHHIAVFQYLVAFVSLKYRL